MAITTTTVMTDFEKVLMLLMTLERLRNPLTRCWCRNTVWHSIKGEMTITHTRDCLDTKAAMRTALANLELYTPDRRPGDPGYVGCEGAD